MNATPDPLRQAEDVAIRSTLRIMSEEARRPLRWHRRAQVTLLIGLDRAWARIRRR